MKRTFSTLSLVTLVVCFLVDPSGAQQKQPPGAKIEAKRLPDLPAGQDRPTIPAPIDINSVKEFNRVLGTCLGHDDKPVDGASVQLFGKTSGRKGKKDAYELVASAETGRDGKFAFENLQTRFKTNKFEKYFILAIRKKGFATKFLTSLVWGTNQPEIKLSRRAMIKGVIKNELGKPVSGARVSMYNPLQEILPDVYATKSGKDGRFQIGDYHTINSTPFRTRDGKLRGSMSVRLRVEHPDYGRVALRVERTPNLFNVTISRGAKFTGQIVDDNGQPVAGCKVSLQSHSRENSSVWFETTSSKGGKFQITMSPHIRANLFFDKENLSGRAIELYGKPGLKTDLGKLKLVKPIVVRGVVIDDETNKPIKLKEKLSMYHIGWHGPNRPKTSARISSTTIQKDGTFECHLLPGINYPYVATSVLQMLGRPYKDGIEITPDSKVKLEFRVRRRKINDR